jgi:hypothetical protein
MHFSISKVKLFFLLAKKMQFLLIKITIRLKLRSLESHDTNSLEPQQFDC